MNISAIFINRPVATTLLTIALALTGIIAFQFLPVSPLPRIDFPTILVQAQLPGADPETMATSVAAPLERQFGRIAGITEMTSTSTRGSTSIILQFDLNRNIDGAARDIQAAINAARSYLPPTLRNNPTYRKVNPSESPIMLISLTSDILPIDKIFDAASTILEQKLAQVEGVGQVLVVGSSLPAVRVELNPLALHKYGISLSAVRGVLATTNINRPKGHISNDEKTWEIETNDQLRRAEEYKNVVVSYRSGAAVRLPDVADVQDSVEDIRAMGLSNGKQAVNVMVFRQPDANIIQTVDQIRRLLPFFEAALPGSIKPVVLMDRSPPIRGSLRDVERSLIIAVVLVILVVFGFLRNIRSTIIPGVAVVVSLIGTFGVMYLFDYNLDNLSLMALTIATGFVVDDAIVVPGKYYPAHRERDARPGSGLDWSPRDVFHGPVHECFPYCRVYADPFNGRNRWPHVPGVRRHVISGRSHFTRFVAHDNSHDVRHSFEAGGAKNSQPSGSHGRSDF